LNQIARDLDRDAFLNAKQACEYGLIDLVGQSAKTI
jgi:ATP-dependent protease ClpP protease subunit